MILGFTIIDKVIVNRSRQYKVKNSCGSVFYITDSSYFVQVKWQNEKPALI
ncbi:Gram-positive endolysin [Bacillus mycoides DSM 2048]|nr:Gram-positive endolysin [Bacillus mycoides DSM 2048]